MRICQIVYEIPEYYTFLILTVLFLRARVSPIYDFWGMSGFEPRELAVTSRRDSTLATHPSSFVFYNKDHVWWKKSHPFNYTEILMYILHACMFRTEKIRPKLVRFCWLAGGAHFQLLISGGRGSWLGGEGVRGRWKGGGRKGRRGVNVKMPALDCVS